MTGLATRRARIVRVREMEHRLAHAQLRVADAALDELNGISARIAALRSALNPACGYTNGLELKSCGWTWRAMILPCP
jgi:hypothetical protein